MAKRTHVQWNFSGGELSTRMLMRADTETYARSVLFMENFQPTLQGSAERSPGSRFVYDTGVTNARLIPYLTPDNKKAFVEITASTIKIQPTIADNLNQPGVVGSADLETTVPFRAQIVENPSFTKGPEPWDLEPEQYTGAEGDTLGLRWTGTRGGAIQGTARLWKGNDIDTCTITTTAEVAQPTDNITVVFRLDYIANFSGTNLDASYDARVQVGTSPGGTEVMDYEFTGPPGTIRDLIQSHAVPGGFTGTLHITVYWQALATAQEPKSAPQFRLDYVNIFANDNVTVGATEVFGDPPWSYSQIDDIHFIQSPYSAPASDPAGPAKQLVLVHPEHPPYHLYFNTDDGMVTPEYPGGVPAGYALLKAPFDDPGGVTGVWGAGNYPSCCSSFSGRLILAGGQDDPEVGGVTQPVTETVWGTKVGDWLSFSDTEGVNADDSIEFTTIYRSPIQWIYGQKQLLIGATEMEYSASADGIFQPADIGVEMHTTHGSNHVQPAGFGKSVLFPSDGGTRVREMMFQNDDQGWVANDASLLNPDLFGSGIKRMVRMRNPHQMCVVLLNNGKLAVLHQDTQAGIAGWSRMNMTAGSRIIDICVVTDSEGIDILFMAVRRRVEGVVKCFVEAIPNWVDYRLWDYTASSTIFLPEVPSNVITGLEHLEGVVCQVVADGDYIGSYLVTGGEITLVNQIGDDLLVSSAVVGRTMQAVMQLLPPAAQDPGSNKYYDTISLRIRNSTRPLINNNRPDDRSPTRIMNKSEELENFEDVSVQGLGNDIYQTIVISETVPLRTEVLGMYGELTETSL